MKPTFKDNQSIGVWVGNLLGVLFIMAPYIGDNIDNYFKFYSNGYLYKISIDLTSLSFFTTVRWLYYYGSTK